MAKTRKNGRGGLRYGDIKSNLERKISLGIGFGELWANLKDCEVDRHIMLIEREWKQEEVNNQLPPIQEGRIERIGDFGKRQIASV